MALAPKSGLLKIGPITPITGYSDFGCNFSNNISPFTYQVTVPAAVASGATYNWTLPSFLQISQGTSSNANSITVDINNTGSGDILCQVSKSIQGITLLSDIVSYHVDVCCLPFVSYICYAFNNPTCQYGHRYYVEYDDNTQSFNTVQLDVTAGAGIDLNPNDASPLTANQADKTFLFRTYDNVYTLPDQIDGEDYWKFTNPNIAISGMNINGQFHPNCDPNNWQEVYNCDHINLNLNLESGEACGIDIKYDPVTKNCDEDPAGFHFFGSIPFPLSSANPLTNFDLLDLKDKYEQGLTTKPGYYKLTAIVTDCCGNKTSASTYVRVLSGISPNFSLEIFDYNNTNLGFCGGGNCYLPASTNINTPNNVGSQSISFTVTGNTGNITTLNVNVVEFDNLLGIPIGPVIINEDRNWFNNNTVTNLNLNNFCAPLSTWLTTPPSTAPTCNISSPSGGYSGFKSYFVSQTTSIAFKYYRLIVTLRNPCSSTSKYAYLYFNTNTSNRAAITDLHNLENNSCKVSVNPNPAQNELNFNFINKSGGSILIQLFDISGRVVKTIKKDDLNGSEEQHIKTDVQNLENGTYFWEVSCNEFNKFGKVIITR